MAPDMTPNRKAHATAMEREDMFAAKRTPMVIRAAEDAPTSSYQRLNEYWVSLEIYLCSPQRVRFRSGTAAI